MFERYTEKARRVIFFARYEASQYGSPHIETEHLLLGLLREDRILALHVLPRLGEGGSIRQEIESQVKVRERISTTVEMPLSEECKRILNFAAQEAATLQSGSIETFHLLLGLLREENCLAARILAKHGAVLDAVREKTAAYILQQGGAAGPPVGRVVLGTQPTSQAKLGLAVDVFLHIWRDRDAPKLATLFAPHGQFWDAHGELWLMPAQIEKGLGAHFASAEPVELVPDIRDVKFVTTDVSVVTLLWKPQGEAKQPAPAMRMALVLHYAHPDWLIVTAHLTLPQPGHPAEKRKR
jgi:uncharacterized protein (TIGR02246 family)